LYDDTLQNELDSKFSARINHFEVTINGAVYCIDFNSNTQYQKNNPSKRRQFKRAIPGVNVRQHSGSFNAQTAPISPGISPNLSNFALAPPVFTSIPQISAAPQVRQRSTILGLPGISTAPAAPSKQPQVRKKDTTVQQVNSAPALAQKVEDEEEEQPQQIPVNCGSFFEKGCKKLSEFLNYKFTVEITMKQAGFLIFVILVVVAYFYSDLILEGGASQPDHFYEDPMVVIRKSDCYDCLYARQNEHDRNLYWRK